MAVNTSSSISTGTALHRFIENKAIEQFKLTSFLYGMGTHRTLKTGDHQYSMPVMNRTVFSAASAVLSEGVTPASTTVGFSQVTFDMVPVVVRCQNMCQVPAALGQLPVDFRRIRRIDGGGFPALVIVQQNAIIVGAADELMNIETGHGDEETLLRRLNSLPPMDMLGRDGYR